MSLKGLFVAMFLFVALVAVSGCAALPNPFAHPTATPTAVPTTALTDDAALEAAARAVIQAMALVNYQDPAPWKKAMLDLSNDDGKKFWQANFDSMLKDVLVKHRVAESVTIDQVAVLGRESKTDAQGQTFYAAIVRVNARMTYRDDQDEHRDIPMDQPMLFANLDGSWKFVEFLPPEVMATVTPGTPPGGTPTPKK